MAELEGELLRLSELKPGMPIELSTTDVKYYCIYEDPLEVNPLTGGYKIVSPTPRVGIVERANPTREELTCRLLVEGKGFHASSITIIKTPSSKIKCLAGVEKRKVRSIWEREQKQNPGKMYSNELFPRSGTDPEVFVELEGNLLPAWEFLGKHNPYGYEKNHWDGFAAEWTTEADTCLQVLHDNTRQGMMRVLERARAKFPKAKLSAKSTVEIPEGLLSVLPEEYVTFGCRPSLNAYGASPVDLGNPRKITMRTAGGHVHFGQISLVTSTDQKLAQIVQKIDAFAGVASVGLMEGLDNPARRKLYGRAGEYRRTSYGLEYRVLSNGWLRHPSLYHLVFELCRIGLNLGWNETTGSLWDASEGEVRECINAGDVSLARKIIERNKVMFLNCVRNAIQMGKKDENAEAAYKAVMEGIGNFLKHPDDIEENWMLVEPSVTYEEDDDGNEIEVGGENEYYERIHEWGTAAKNILQNKKI